MSLDNQYARIVSTYHSPMVFTTPTFSFFFTKKFIVDLENRRQSIIDLENLNKSTKICVLRSTYVLRIIDPMYQQLWTATYSRINEAMYHIVFRVKHAP